MPLDIRDAAIARKKLGQLCQAMYFTIWNCRVENMNEEQRKLAESMDEGHMPREDHDDDGVNEDDEDDSNEGSKSTEAATWQTLVQLYPSYPWSKIEFLASANRSLGVQTHKALHEERCRVLRTISR